MKNNSRIFLIGMPGSGKTTLGRKLAIELDMPFLDLDEVIEDHEQTKVGNIFNTQGEDYFRNQERLFLRTTAMEHHSLVLATGGGTPCFFDNLTFMKENGKVVFIDVSVKELTKRLRKEGIAKRPLLSQKTSNEALEEYLEDIFNKRKSYYQQADVMLNDSQSLEEILKVIRN